MSIGTSAQRGNRRAWSSPKRPAPIHRAAGAMVESLENRWLLSAGDLDATFGAGGLVTTGFIGSTVDTSSAVAKDASGRIVVAGNQGGTNDILVARYLPGGALDTSFGNQGKAVIDLGGADVVGAIAVDASGIYLAGATGFNMALARLDNSGALDTTFGGGDGVAVASLAGNSAADAIALVTGGIYIGGTATVGAHHEFAVAKFDAAGSPVGSSATPIGDDAQLTALLADGSDVVAGGYSTTGGNTSFTLSHYGSSQWTTITNFGADSQIAALANHGGKILAIGNSNGALALAQYTFGGTPDTSFNTANTGSPSTYLDPTTSGVVTVRTGGLDSTGRLVVAGRELDVSPGRVAAVRYTLSGGPARDLTYGVASSNISDTLQAATVSADGSAVLVGVASGPDQGSNFGGALLDDAGAVTATFNTDFTGPTTDMGAATVTDSAGRTIVAGTRTQVLDDGIVQHVVLVRYTPTGAVDTTFGAGGVAVVNFGTRDETFQSLALDASGNVLVAGLDQAHGIKVERFVNGTLDTGFGTAGILTVTGVTLGDTSAAVRVAADGNKVVVAGTTVTGVVPTANEDFYVRRYNADGTPDGSFNGGNIVTFEPRLLTVPTNGDDLARAVLVLSDGTIIVGGSSHSDDTGSDQFAIVQFSATGTPLVAAFQDFGGDATIKSLALQGTNVVAAGSAFNDTIALARFDTAIGTFDNTFGTSGVVSLDTLSTSGGAGGVVVDTQGQIGVVGALANSAGDLIVVRLTPDGALDTDFSGDGVVSTGLVAGENNAAGITSDSAGNLVAVGSRRVTPLNSDYAAQRFLSGYAPVVVNPTVAITGAPASSPEGTAINLTSSVTAGSGSIVSYSWAVTQNGNPYSSGTGANFTFTPNDNAAYVVTLTVTASDGGTGSDMAVISVTNVAPTPTIHGAPASSPEGTPITLSATSTDPGALDTVTYAWSVTKNGNAYASGTGASFTFTPNDNASYVVTLTATDNDPSSGSTAVTISVVNVNPTVAINGAPATSVAGTPISLSSTVTDPAGVNDPITYAWSVTRNGVAYGTPGAGASYSFTPADAATYVVTLTVNDGDGGVASDTGTITVNPLPTTVSATLTGGLLALAGDGAANTINVSLNAAGDYHVVIGTQVDQVFAFAAVNNILIQAGAGNDVITVANGVAIPAEIHGGDGNDVIQAGGGNDMLFGEDGNDILAGASGNDILIGGAGSDVLSGGNGRDILVGGLGSDVITGDNGDDILIGGGTTYNNDPVGLSAIRDIWTGGGSYATRVNALKANLLKPANLFNDSAIDLLSGNNGQDWIIASSSDLLLGIAGNEVVTTI